MTDNKSAFSSSEYDRNIRDTVPFYEDFFVQIADAVRARKSDAVSWLDVGCGTGEMARTVLNNIGIERFVFCDSSEKMLAVAESRSAAPNTEFIRADIRSLPYNEEFDVVTAIMINHYFGVNDRVKAVRNCFNALKSDGMYFCFENFAPTENLTELYLKRWRQFQLERGRSKEECERHISRYGKEYFPITINGEINIIKSCGFRAAEILWVSCMQAGFLAIK